MSEGLKNNKTRPAEKNVVSGAIYCPTLEKPRRRERIEPYTICSNRAIFLNSFERYLVVHLLGPYSACLYYILSESEYFY